MGWKTFILPEIKLRQEEAFLKNGGFMSFSREFFWVSSTDSPCLWYFYIGKNDLKIQSPAVVLGGKIPMKPLLQWRFQDSKMEVPYHIRLWFVGIFPEISAEQIGLKNRWCLGTSSLGTSIPWPLTIGCIGASPGVLRWTVTSQHRRLFVFDARVVFLFMDQRECENIFSALLNIDVILVKTL